MRQASAAAGEPPDDGVGVLFDVAAFGAFSDGAAEQGGVSDAAARNAAIRAREVSLTHLALGVLSFATLPVLLAFGLRPSGAEFAAFAAMAVPVMAAIDLSRAGKLDRALGLTAAAFSGLAALVAASTGGLASPAAALLLLPLIDAALAGSRRGMIAAGVAGAVALLGIAASQISGSAAPGANVLALVGAVAAMVYALALAARAAAVVSRAERDDGASDARFELFAGGFDDLVTRHGANGAVTFASPAARETLGATARELLDQGLFQRVHIADRPAFLHALSKAADATEGRRVEIRIRHAADDGASFRWMEMRARRVRSHEAGAASAIAAPVVATFRDIEARRAHEAALAAARAESETAQLAKTRFLAHMSHELRTPLNAVIGFSEALSDDKLCPLTPERRADYAALIHRSGVHLLDVVNSILDVAKFESGAFSIAPRALALAPLVEQAVALMSLKAETAGVLLKADIAADAPDVNADPRAVTQIALNLLSNAVKFTPRGGEVTIALRSSRGGARLMVSDTGCGVAPEHVARLGEAFYQVDNGAGSRDGAGLGLSVVRSLVMLHAGEMTIESALGRGTSVAVRLPAAEAPSSALLAGTEFEKVRRRA